MRILAEPQVSLRNRQRLDLNVASYDQLLFDPSLMLRFEPGRRIFVEAGGGVALQRILGVNEVEGAPELIDRYPSNAARPFVRVRAEISLGSRRDVAHEVEADTRFLYAPDQRTFELDLDYSLVVRNGYDLAMAHVGTTSVLGDVPFTRERSIGRFLRGVYGARHFTDLGAGATLEYQLSVARDLFRVAAFHDLAVFRATDRNDGTRRPAIANSFGLGLTGLVLDTFDATAYYAVGFNSVGSMSHGVSLSISQIF